MKQIQFQEQDIIDCKTTKKLPGNFCLVFF